MSKKILVLLGHPDADNETFSSMVADRYQASAEDAGHDVARVNIGDISFDPILHKGYKEIQELEPDLVDLQQKVQWADHIVIIYPNWWCTMPAILKGLFDRFWLPGFAFNFDKKTRKVIKRLAGKTGRVIIISGTHSPFKTWWKFGDYTNEIQYGIMEFAGIDTRVTSFGPCERASEKCKMDWFEDVSKLGARAN